LDKKSKCAQAQLIRLMNSSPRVVVGFADVELDLTADEPTDTWVKEN
jgi:hypothetical protein